MIEYGILESQKAFFKTGQTLPVPYRKMVLSLLEDLIRQKVHDIEDALFKDLGKSRQEAFTTEISLVLTEIKHARRKLSRWASPKRKPASVAHLPGKMWTEQVPFGSVLILAPWNYPFLLSLSPVISALAAGNCIVLKPSEFAPHTAWCVAGLLGELFSPAYVSVLQGGADLAAQLCTLSFDKIFFTGSASVGKKVLAAAAENLVPATLELGGKSPCIVDETADIKKAAKRIMWGKLLCCGQTCVAPDYVLVHQSVKERFMRECRSMTESFLGVNPLESPDYGRIVNQKHYNRLLELLKEGRIRFGRETNPITLQIAPTLIDQIGPDSAVMQQEIFGPILPVLGYENLAQAFAIVARNPNPLAAYFFSKDEKNLDLMQTAFSYGGCCINDTIMHLPTVQLPFGGVGTSGMGSCHGKYGFETFSRPVAHYRRLAGPETRLRYPPYSLKAYRILRKLFR